MLRKLITFPLLSLALLAAPAVLEAQVCFNDVLLTVSEDDNLLREVSLDDFTAIATHPLNAPGFPPVLGATGIAVHPDTGQIFVLLRTDQPPPLNQIFLATVDIDNGDFVDVLGSTFVEFVGLSFDNDDRCISISADGANPANAFCELSQTNGAPDDLCAATAGDDGDGVAYYAPTDQVFHAAGSADVILETIDVETGPGAPCGTTAVDISGSPLVDTPFGAITYWGTDDSFLWSVLDGPDTVYSVSPTGDAAAIGTFDHTPAGMTVRQVQVTCPTEFFVRGDADGNGSFTALVDGLFILNYQFVPGSPTPPCLKAADADGNGSVTGLVDGLFILNFGFVPGSPPPPPPYPSCGDDPSSMLSCDAPLSPPC